MLPVKVCKSIGCSVVLSSADSGDFCYACRNKPTAVTDIPMSKKYPQYYKSVEDVDEVDVYAVHQLFDIQDPSGCIQHASKKLLLSGVRTGGKSVWKDIREARDTLTRWLQLNPEPEPDLCAT